MAKEEAESYISSVLAKKDLPTSDRIRLERALRELRGEEQVTMPEVVRMSVKEAAHMINEKIGARLGDDVALVDLYHGKPTYPAISVPNDALEFCALVKGLPRNVKTMLAKSLFGFVRAEVDTVGKVRKASLSELRAVYHVDKRAVFLKTVFERPKPQE